VSLIQFLSPGVSSAGDHHEKPARCRPDSPDPTRDHVFDV